MSPLCASEYILKGVIVSRRKLSVFIMNISPKTYMSCLIAQCVQPFIRSSSEGTLS